MATTLNAASRRIAMRVGAFGFITALVMLATLAIAPARADAAATYRFEPVRMIVHDIEDWWPDSYDEPRMYYSDQVWAATVRNKQTVEGSEIPQAHFTGTQMQIDLWERDNGWYDNNHLGTVWITPAALDDERTARFGCPTCGWHYELVYKVVQVGW